MCSSRSHKFIICKHKSIAQRYPTMRAYTPPYQLTDAILRLSTEIAATVKEITVRGNLSAQPQPHPFRSFFAGD